MSLTINDNITKLYMQKQQQVSNPVENINTPKTPEQTITDTKREQRKKLATEIGTALGVAASIAILAKTDKTKKYSLSPKKILNTKLKDTYILSKTYKSKEIIAMGIGSCLGGLAGSCLYDKKQDLSPKLQESITQILNISVPIVFVEGLSILGGVAEKAMSSWTNKGGILRKTVSKLPKVVGSMTGLACGMFVGNKMSNTINKHLFKDKEENRPIKLSDFSAHIDDICVAATFIAENNPITKIVSRFIPLALCVAGNEVGEKTKNSQK